MGTLKTHGDRAKLKVRDTGDYHFTDANRMGVVNDILEDIYQRLMFMESNLVYAEGSITTEDGTMEYTPGFDHNGFLHDGVWLDGEDFFLGQVEEADKVRYDYGSTTSEPEAYYIAEDGKVGFLWVPDDAYTVYVQYWKPITQMSDYDDDDLPWGGIFNNYIQRRLVIEMKIILEQDTTSDALMAEMEYDRAINLVYARGIRQRRQISDMFSVEGI